MEQRRNLCSHQNGNVFHIPLELFIIEIVKVKDALLDEVRDIPDVGVVAVKNDKVECDSFRSIGSNAQRPNQMLAKLSCGTD